MPPPAASSARCRCQRTDRKSTRLNSSHLVISYAVFCLKKKITFATMLTRTSTYMDDAIGNRSSSTTNGKMNHYLIDPTGLGDIVAAYIVAVQQVTDYT